MQERQFDREFYRSLLDAMPVPVFVVDHDMRIIDMNRMATVVFAMDLPTVFRQRGGEALHCLHSTDAPEGCGHGPHCKSCVMRNAVKESTKGAYVSRRRTKVEFMIGNKSRKLDILVTASPIPGPEKLTLLSIEDISEVIRLRNLIPICPRCRVTRQDDEYWVDVKSYFTESTGSSRGESVCPDCRKEVVGELANVGSPTSDLV